jgi:HK97 family phage prohead protease
MPEVTEANTCPAPGCLAANDVDAVECSACGATLPGSDGNQGAEDAEDDESAASDPDSAQEGTDDDSARSIPARATRAKYSAAQLKTMMGDGEAMANSAGDPSFPIADAEDLGNAIHAVGLGNKSNNSIRVFIMKRAKALGLSSKIPDTWNADGSVTSKSSAGPPRDSLIRSVEFRAEPSDGLTLEGYAAVFDDPAMIDSWEGTFRERIMPGAFDKTIAERKPVLMFDHGQHPMVGSIPIGTITDLRPDARGLYVKATLADNWLIEPVRDAVRSGAISGMSIRMSVINDDWGVGRDRVPERSVREVALAELGPVVFPAYENTQVSVRSREIITALADPEVRTELARIFASGTDLESAAVVTEPVIDHSAATSQLRRRAKVLLATL